MSDSSPERHSNRRLTARTACHLTVRYRADGEWRRATAMDVSRHGCRVRLGEDIERGTAVRVCFETAGAEGSAPVTVEVPGTVIWSRLEGLSYQAGVQFEEAADLDPILNAF